MTFSQSNYDIRCEWGLAGVLALAPQSQAVVVIDVLSFSTAVEIAVSRGAEVLPYRWNDASAQTFAIAKRAHLAAPRGQAGYSLSPASLESIHQGESLVLPSPNGSTMSLEAAVIAPTWCACLRNAPAVAARLRSNAQRIAVIPAGEQWDDGSLRPCLEDLIGAGAVIAELPGSRSPEADLAVAAFERFRSSLEETISNCGSGRELAQRGFHRDLELASALNVSQAAPVFSADRFRPS